MQIPSASHTSPASPPPPSSHDGDLFSQTVARRPDRAVQLITAAEQLLTFLCRGQALEAKTLRSVMVAVFGGSDSGGAWNWKDVYEAQELAALLFVRKYREALSRREPAAVLATLEKLQSLLATQTRRSDVSQRWQQFSTPLPLGYVVAQAAGLVTGDVVLEPSAGTGLLALFAEGIVADLRINELEPGRRALLRRLFPGAGVSDHNAEYIDDLLPRGLVPSVVLMNPPFSTSPTMSGTSPAVAGRHVFSALNRLTEGGRLVAITGRNFFPGSSKWRAAFERLQGIGRIVFSAPLAGKIYAKHGTSFETRLSVIDKLPADDPKDFSGYVPELVDSTA
ncbi:MAG: methylase, partial [Gammaproteobacteria bacterium]|nr:methylase [Gammaproteobacteria bacterium]